MKTQDLTINLLFDQSPEQVFQAINDVRGWWSEEIEGNTDKLQAAFTYHFEDLHRCELVITEMIPNEKVVWLVKSNYFQFTKDKTEWTGTNICFDITREGNQTRLHFTHAGLTPEFECFEICTAGWNQYIRQSLASLVKTGKGQPNATGKPRTKEEEKLRSS